MIEVYTGFSYRNIFLVLMGYDTISLSQVLTYGYASVNSVEQQIPRPVNYSIKNTCNLHSAFVILKLTELSQKKNSLNIIMFDYKKTIMIIIIIKVHKKEKRYTIRQSTILTIKFPEKFAMQNTHYINIFLPKNKVIS